MEHKINDFYNRGSAFDKFAALILSISLYLNGNFFIQLPYIYYIVVILIFLIYLFFILKKLKISNFSFLTLFFYCSCFLSLMINIVDPIFDSYNRFLFFFLLTVLVGPLILTKKLEGFRFLLFRYIMEINVIFVGLSYIFSIFGIHAGYSYDYVNNQYRPDFAGLYNHSMTLGPMAAISVLYCLNKYLNLEKFKYYYLLFGFISFLVCLIAGSRVGLLSLVLAIFVYVYMINKGRLHYIFSIFFVAIGFLILLFPLYQSNLDFLISKFTHGQDSGSVTVSRDAKWLARLAEFYSSPIWGIGYGVVDKNLDKVGDNGVIEPGSSWLSILSMTGILGFLSIFLLYIKSALGFLNFTRSSNHYFVLSILVLTCVYMIAEGAFLAGGNFMCLILWLVLSISYTLSNSIMKK